ncbi:hypothetical protein HQS73_003606 [Salmonella enterica]|nr:hypothetical protein [Salmonella enterica]EAZ5906737.1 hypothetical protein [Salmonella enterica]EFV4530975.1 hypothetical protein [Salmonella enterica]EFW6053000.1 hypothetical protein [Salmonella enterica]EHF3428160.1 hypothetical protein [Salmonella enterica]
MALIVDNFTVDTGHIPDCNGQHSFRSVEGCGPLKFKSCKTDNRPFAYYQTFGSAAQTKNSSTMNSSVQTETMNSSVQTETMNASKSSQTDGGMSDKRMLLKNFLAAGIPGIGAVCMGIAAGVAGNDIEDLQDEMSDAEINSRVADAKEKAEAQKHIEVLGSDTTSGLWETDFNTGKPVLTEAGKTVVSEAGESASKATYEALQKENQVIKDNNSEIQKRNDKKLLDKNALIGSGAMLSAMGATATIALPHIMSKINAHHNVNKA